MEDNCKLIKRKIEEIKKSKKALKKFERLNKKETK